MPKPNRLTSREDALNILEQGSYGILSTVSIDGQPYGVPVNYVYLKEENCIFFHCAMIGKKIDNMTANNKVSFTVVLYEKIIQEKYTTYYEGVIAEGTVSFITDEKEKRQKLFLLCERFSPDFSNSRKEFIDKYANETAIYKININEISGKRNI